jgi:indole-3-glycerol phosphate synthase
MPNVLTRIIANKRREVTLAKRQLPLDALRRVVRAAPKGRRSFAEALRKKPIGLIAEVKLKSPSGGTLTSTRVERLAQLYAKSPASAVSVLTDRKYFNGSLENLVRVRAICPQPVLRKDFIIDEYQVYESAFVGADALLLIVSALSKKKLRELLVLAGALKLEALVEVHSAAELRTALAAGAKIIGINNRNLKTLKVDIKTTGTLLRHAKKGPIYVSESGIESRADVIAVKKAGVHAILVGSAIVTAKNPSAKLRELSLH